MVSEISGSLASNVNIVEERFVSRSCSKKRNSGKVPKKIHKAEREKMKRDHMNELFLELANALETTRPNCGKASTLDEAARFLRDLLTQVKALKRENSALLSESHYITAEKNELKDENAVLESEIDKLQTQLGERTQVEPGFGSAPTQFQINNSPPQFPEGHHLSLPVTEPTLQSSSVMGPVLVIPLHPDVRSCPDPDASQTSYKTSSNVTKPQPRYPTPSDSWPSQLLGKNPKAVESSHLKTNSSGGNRDEQASS